MVASGARPFRFAQSSLESTRAPAPSFTPGAFPAVCAPSLWNAPLSLESASSVDSRRGASQAVAEARLLEHVRGVRHRLHAAGPRQVEVAGAHGLVDHSRRAEPGGAHLVDRLRGDLLGNPGLDLSL